VAVDLDARSEDSIGQIPQSPGLPVAMIHVLVYTLFPTQDQLRLSRINFMGRPSDTLHPEA
jgi:hypothetical protein